MCLDELQVCRDFLDLCRAVMMRVGCILSMSDRGLQRLPRQAQSFVRGS